MKVLTSILCLFVSVGVFSAEVRWDCFALCDYSSYEDKSIGCYYIDPGRSSPEIGLRLAYDSSGNVRLDGNGPANCGYNVAIWVDAIEGDILNREYFELEHIVLKDSYNVTAQVPIELNAVGDEMRIGQYEHFYLALIGDYFNDDNARCDYYGWVELKNTGREIAIVSSAFSYGNLEVGGGAVPEPSSALLMVIGCAGLLLRRRAI